MTGEVRSLHVFDGEEDGIGIFYLLTVFILFRSFSVFFVCRSCQYQRSLTFLFKMLVVIIRRSIGIVIHQSERNLGIAIQIRRKLLVDIIVFIIRTFIRCTGHWQFSCKSRCVVVFVCRSTYIECVFIGCLFCFQIALIVFIMSTSHLPALDVYLLTLLESGKGGKTIRVVVVEVDVFLIGITRDVGIIIIVETSNIPVVDFCRIRIRSILHGIESGRRAVVDDISVVLGVSRIQWEDEVTGGFQETFGCSS